MQTRWTRKVAAAVLVLGVSVVAGEVSDRRFLCTGHGVVCLVSADGSIAWEHKAGGACYSAWMRPNGNVVFTFKRGAREVNREHDVVWEYIGPEGCEIHSCSPLGADAYLIAEAGASPRILEVGLDGAIRKEIPVQTGTKRVHGQFRQVRKTAAGTYLLAQTGERKVCEYGVDGTVVRTISVPGNPFVAVRLPDGHTLIACGDGHRLIEVDGNDKVVWEITENELPGHPLRFVAGVHRLANGNTVVCNWGGHGHVRQQPQVFEVTRDKQVVWCFDDKDRQPFRTIASIHVLDDEPVPASAVDVLR